jgi:uncharacterized protein YndB with AHSA1/START domain
MTETHTVTVERDLPYPPERIWRALTQPHLISEWLMQTDFSAEMGRKFTFTADWGAVACDVREIEPGRRLSYSWVALGLDSLVTWTLTPTEAGTRLRMEQSGFRKDQGRAYGGARQGWPVFIDKLADVLVTLD